MKIQMNRHMVACLTVVLVGVVGWTLFQWIDVFSPSARTLEVEVPIRPVKTLVIESSKNQVRYSLPGRVQASQRVDLAFRVGGPLIEFPVDEGQKVEQGEVLARIDPRDFQSNVDDIQSAIQQVKAELKAMKVGARPEDIKVLEAQVSAAEATLREAELQLNRFQSLLDKGDITKSQLDTQKAAFDVAQAQVDTCKEQLNVGRRGARSEDIEAKKSQIQSLEAKVQIAQAALKDTYLCAPFAGLVAKKMVDNYQHVEPKDPIISLQDISTIEIVVNLPEQDIVHQKPHRAHKIVARFDAIPTREFVVELKEFGAKADPQTKTYPLTVCLPQPEGIQILAGMTAEITFIEQNDQETSNRFEIPVEAVFGDEQGKSFVWIVDEQEWTVHQNEINQDRLTGDRIVVTQGLQSGQRIVTAGVHYLRDGMKIQLWGKK